MCEARDAWQGKLTGQFLDCAKAARVLAWSPKVGLEDALRQTVDWYRPLLRREAPVNLNES